MSIGELAILNVGDGDTRITFDPAKPDELIRAKRIVTDMLRLGYAIMVKVGDVWQRAKDFDAERCEYIVEDVPAEGSAAAKPPKRRGTRGRRRVPARGTPAVSVARSAGGMSDRADSIEMQNLRAFDNFAPLRAGLAQLAEEREQWAGIPMPLEDHPLVVEPRYPHAAALMAFGRAALDEAKEDEAERAYAAQRKLRGQFYSVNRRAEVVIWEEPDGRIEWGLHHAIHSFSTQLSTLGAQEAWGIEQESAAMQTLAELVRHRQMKQYLLTGSFLETSRRSGLTYMFRRLRPTVVIDGRDQTQSPKIRCALCMHPIAYYRGSWAGAMCPTDDVIAALMLMRGDEPMFWKRSNQHPAYRPEAGL